MKLSLYLEKENYFIVRKIRNSNGEEIIVAGPFTIKQNVEKEINTLRSFHPNDVYEIKTYIVSEVK